MVFSDVPEGDDIDGEIDEVALEQEVVKEGVGMVHGEEIIGLVSVIER